jgi:hypothetical protein
MSHDTELLLGGIDFCEQDGTLNVRDRAGSRTSAYR